MVRTRKTWVYSSPKTPASKVPTGVKDFVQQKANELVETFLKARYIKPPPKGYRFNYLVDIYTKWYRHYFYLCGKYRSPGPHALSPFFETKFARLEYRGRDQFHLAFMRYTGEWIELYHNLSLDECLARVKEEPFFQP